MVQNPDFAHVVDLRKVKKVEAGEVDGRKCVSLFFTEKLQKYNETVRFIVRVLLRLPYSAPLECMRMRLISLQEMHVSFDSPAELAGFLEVIRASKP